MTACLKCGAQNQPTNKYCARCEMPLAHSGVGGTLTGEPDQHGASATRDAGQRTLFGIAPRASAAGNPTPTVQRVAPVPAPQAAPVPHPAPVAPQTPPSPVAGQRTLMGIVPKGLAQAIDAAQVAAPAPKGEASAKGPLQARGQASHRNVGANAFEAVRSPTTMLGAVPAGGDTALEEQSPLQAAGHADRSWSELDGVVDTRLPADAAAGRDLGPVPVDASGGNARTHLGVAIPGVAPLRSAAGAAKPAAAPKRAAPLEGTWLQPPESSSGSFGIPARIRMPRSAVVLMCSGVVLLASAAAFAVFWRSSSPVSAVVSADAAGKDRIDVVCEDCPDGTVISLAGESAEVSARKAYLTPARALALGRNDVSFEIRRPDASKAQTLKLSLPPVEYRIRPDTSTLVGDQPRLTLKIEAIPGSKVEIGTTPVTLDAAGQGAIAIDLGSQLIGPASDVVTIDQSVGYVIVPPHGKEYRGELGVKIGISPLILEAPGTDTVTDMERFMLAGRTSIGAEIWVAGNALPVDGTGRFAQLMSIDAIGETQVSVRASQAGLAPRFVSFRLQRVKEVEQEAKLLRPGALSLAEVVGDIPAHLGKKVWVEGKIEEVRLDGHRTLVLLQADKDCAEQLCLARLVYGGLRKLKRGTRLSALGRLRGAVGTTGAQNVPEIEVSLIL